MKYLLSTGEVTERFEYYILDLFKINLQVYPSDIPGAPGIGFNFIFNDVKKDEVVSEIQSRVSQLASNIQQKVDSSKYKIVVDSIEVIDEARARVTISINEQVTDSVIIDIYDSEE